MKRRSAPSVSWRNVGVLTAATSLLLFAAALHLAFFRAFPDPLFDSDSPGYFRPALSLLYRGHLAIHPFRTEGYPLFLFSLLRLFHSFSAVLVAQHLLLLLTAALTAAFYWTVVDKNAPLSFLAGWLVLIAPEPLIYSHW